MRLIDLVEQLKAFGIDACLIGDESHIISQVASLAQASENHLSFFSDPRRLDELKTTRAGCVLLTKDYSDETRVNQILVDNPYYAYACLAQKLNPRPFTVGIAETAVIGEGCDLADDIDIEANVVIGDRVRIGSGCYIGAGCVLEPGVVLGDNCYLYPNVTIMYDSVIGNQVTIESGTVIGGQGFGNANHKGEWLHIPQLGKVVIGSRVWIGNNCAIDRGAIEDTIIADNCLIDNLVHIAHNVKIGYGCALAGQVGFAGSTTVGAHCTMGGQVGIAGHLTLADNTHYFAKAGVTHSIKQSGVYSGFPAVPVKEWQKTTVKVKGIDKLSQKMKLLEKELMDIKAELAEACGSSGRLGND